MKKYILMLICVFAIIASNTQKSFGTQNNFGGSGGLCNIWVYCAPDGSCSPPYNSTCNEFAVSNCGSATTGCPRCTVGPCIGGGGVWMWTILQESPAFDVGIDTGYNLVLYDRSTRTRYVLLSNATLNGDFGVTYNASADTVLDLAAYLGGASLTLKEKSVIWSSTGDSIYTLISSTTHTYNLSGYRLEGNVIQEEPNGSINLISNYGNELIKFDYSNNSNYNLAVYNSLGQRVMNTPIQNDANYSVSNLSPGIYFAIINDSKNAILRRKFVIR